MPSLCLCQSVMFRHPCTLSSCSTSHSITFIFLSSPCCPWSDYFRKKGVPTPTVRRLFEAVTVSGLPQSAIDALTDEAEHVRQLMN